MWGSIRVRLALYGNNGKENGNYFDVSYIGTRPRSGFEGVGVQG